MIPSIGGLSNSGSMPISASGGMAGPSTATARNSIGGIRNGSMNFGAMPAGCVEVPLFDGPRGVLRTRHIRFLGDKTTAVDHDDVETSIL